MTGKTVFCFCELTVDFSETLIYRHATFIEVVHDFMLEAKEWIIKGDNIFISSNVHIFSSEHLFSEANFYLHNKT